MNKKYDMIGLFVVGSENATGDKESAKAQKQWEKDGTVTAKYLEQTLGDISKGILAVAPRVKTGQQNTRRRPRTP